MVMKFVHRIYPIRGDLHRIANSDAARSDPFLEMGSEDLLRAFHYLNTYRVDLDESLGDYIDEVFESGTDSFKLFCLLSEYMELTDDYLPGSPNIFEKLKMQSRFRSRVGEVVQNIKENYCVKDKFGNTFPADDVFSLLGNGTGGSLDLVKKD